MKKLLVLALLTLGCAQPKNPTHVSKQVSFEQLQPAFQKACYTKLQSHEEHFCSCVWDQAKVLYSPEELKKGVSNGSLLKMQMWRLMVLENCMGELEQKP